jgi:multicomponent Na+:H+ antiporter subunit A
VLGSVLTTAYGLRFIWGAFWTKKDASGAPRPSPNGPTRPSASSPRRSSSRAHGRRRCCGAAPRRRFSGYADTLPSAGEDGHPYHLALWHGLEPALFLSLGAIAVGRSCSGRRTAARRFAASSRSPRRRVQRHAPRIARIAVWTTTFTQRGSLPVYVGTIFVVFVAAQGTAFIGGLVSGADWQISLDAWQTPCSSSSRRS